MFPNLDLVKLCVAILGGLVFVYGVVALLEEDGGTF